ncbi:membrane peptidoglycan carboxypeptidase [Pontibacter ummariensis]|uniref:peptidoglycan glycosyltransferase n=1 Tax=Pontibacter ummariensis TaxID=1610492 RepID=A0A239B9Q4_9BACT|nr:transglycosylase domain-containing protein [Pontibacter ummariensis]PRY16396.1 membrane peptidoglycan carboxypeptidase [Pontibacter ummariensis]SNS04429.1 Membrane carboxypeptidase (penicillin-binding protein) [Pontibacter ummariensis]
MTINNYRPLSLDRKEKKHASILKWTFFGILLLGLVAVIAFLGYEMHTSRFQAQELSSYATTLTYHLDDGPSDKVIYPKSGPFDTRLGYAQLPQLLERLRSRGMEIKQQTRFSPALMEYASKGFYIPYPEKSQAGLHIGDCRGETVYASPYPRRIYASYDSIPPVIVQSLLFIENRELLDMNRPYMNPAVDWGRFTKAIMHQAAQAIGLNYRVIGGSTLSTQIEKFRHSPEGITSNAQEKLRQMISASVRTYQAGPETFPARQAVVLSYVNTVPLSGAPGYGEVHGLGDGLWVWFGSDLDQVNELLRIRNPQGDTLLAQGRALRQVLSLMIAQRRPSYYLGSEGHAELSDLTAGYLRLMADHGRISPELRDASLAQEIVFRNFKENPAVEPMETDKGALMARTRLSVLLNKSLYDLDRLDLAATTTLQGDLQEQVSSYLNRLNDPEFASTVGLIGERLLSPNRTKGVRYSFTLFERTPHGNLVRVQTDNTDQPFDINEDSKLELGSTAKLRVFITYLEIMAEIHERYADQPVQSLHQALREPQDNLSRWALHYLISTDDKTLAPMLQAALQRRYSANPYEAFFTGGGMHTFRNFSSNQNGLHPTVQEALLKSINLPFVRLMRDLVYYSNYQAIGDRAKLLADDNDPRRREYLMQFADREGQKFLLRFWQKYEGKSEEERLNKILGNIRQHPVQFALVHRFLYPETDSVSFGKFLRERLPQQELTDERVGELYRQYGPDAYNLSDQGYIASVHPLELWLLSYMLQEPGAGWKDVVEASKDERQDVYKWLFRTRYKSARDSRIRTMLELAAFQDIQQRWKRLGYPFDELVPSLATALGSSGDRPEALAELMGIIMNNGERQRTLRIEELHFAAHTPYETALKWSPKVGEQVMAPEVAALVRANLSEVVDEGTARRLRGGFTRPDGEPLHVGGKTGTGDNRIFTLTAGGRRVASKALNRTATFVFFLGDHHFGTLTAFVPGRESADFHFTSSLPVQVLEGMAPILEPYLEQGINFQQKNVPDSTQVSKQAIALKAGELTP